MTGLEAFIDMGGYGGYIWPAYGIVTVVLVVMFVASHRFANRSAAELEALNPRGQRKRGNGNEA